MLSKNQTNIQFPRQKIEKKIYNAAENFIARTGKGNNSILKLILKLKIDIFSF